MIGSWGKMKVMGLAVLVCCAAPAGADAAQKWTSGAIDQPGLFVSDASVATYGRDGKVVLLSGRADSSGWDTPLLRVLVRAPGSSAGPRLQTLAENATYGGAIAGSAKGGALAAWPTRWGDEVANPIKLAELEPDGSQFGPAFNLEGSRSTTPDIAVGSGGEAAVAYVGQGADYLNRLMVAFRPAGGEFGPVKPIGDPPTDWAYVTDIDIGGDGTLAIGLVQDHDPVVWVRSPSGRWSGPIELAHDGLDAPPEVEVDGSGTVVAAVVRPLNEGDWPDTGPLDITLIDADGSIVTQPLNRWMEVDSANGFDLQVSNLGEIIVVGEVTAPYVTDEFETRQMVGIWGVFGNSKRHRIGDPMAMTAPGSRSPSLSMNPRGDAVMIWEEALRLHSYRRAPGGSFERPVGIPPTPVPSGEGLAWPHPAGVGVDELGNASVLWTEWNPLMRWYMGDDGPPLTEAPEASPIGQELPPVLAHPYTEYSPVPIPVEEPFVPWTPPYREPRPPKIDPNDHEPPEVVLWTIPRVTQKGIQLKARCNERCEVHLRARIDAPFRLKPVRKVLGENRIGQVTLVAPGDASALAKAADAESRLRIRGTVTDEAGNSRAVHAHTRLVPPDEIHSKP